MLECWNVGMLECWNVGMLILSGSFSFIDFLVNTVLPINQSTSFSEPNIPLFQHSSCERSELSSIYSQGEINYMVEIIDFCLYSPARVRIEKLVYLDGIYKQESQSL